MSRANRVPNELESSYNASQSKVKLQMEALALASSRTANPSSKLTIIGDLRLLQKEPVRHRGHDFRFNASRLADNNFDGTTLADMLREYSRQNCELRKIM